MKLKSLWAVVLPRIVLALRARWQCFRSGGHALKWVRNIYGDEINARNGMRSEWKCTHCGSYQMRPELLRENMTLISS
jgi:hypothetical protein